MAKKGFHFAQRLFCFFLFVLLCVPAVRGASSVSAAGISGRMCHIAERSSVNKERPVKKIMRLLHRQKLKKNINRRSPDCGNALAQVFAGIFAALFAGLVKACFTVACSSIWQEFTDGDHKNAWLLIVIGSLLVLSFSLIIIMSV